MKPENVIIIDDKEDNIRIKIIAFGFSCFKEELKDEKGILHGWAQNLVRSTRFQQLLKVCPTGALV